MSDKPISRGIRWILWWLFIVFVFVLLPILSIFPNLFARKDYSGLEGMNNVKYIMLAIHNYASTDSDRIPRSPPDRLPQTWRTIVLRFLDQSALQRAYREELPWNHDANLKVARTYLKIWEDPYGPRRERDPAGRYLTDFGLISGPGTVLPPQRRVTLYDISDGMSQTLMIGECTGLRIVWTEPRDPDVSREEIGIEQLTKPGQSSKKLLSTHSPYGVIAGFADGRVQMLSHSIDPQVLKAFTTIDGGEPFTESDFLR